MNRLGLIAAVLVSTLAMASGSDVDRALGEFDAAKGESQMLMLGCAIAVGVMGVGAFLWMRKRK